METNAANERKQKEALADKMIEALMPGPKLIKLKNLLQIPEGSNVEDVTPQLYSELANKKNLHTKLSIIQQDVNDYAVKP